MKSGDVEALIRTAFPDAQIYVEGEGCDFSAIVISDQFDGCMPVQKQKQVLATVSGNLASGELHAMSVRAYTQAEWQQKKVTDSAAGLIQIK